MNKAIRARALGINRKNIYYKSLLTEKDISLKDSIYEIHKKHPSYGHKRLSMDLQINHKRILRVMKKFGIKPPRRKINHYCTRSISHPKYSNPIKEYRPRLKLFWLLSKKNTWASSQKSRASSKLSPVNSKLFEMNRLITVNPSA